ncbi:LamG-like jellyroll fold domain-containing protein [Mongoliitalea daihaiensis]|uniref:LamG-like jellyroll fold domain-containing protein n=1 Tax=Mongoliitalea daihaiensis TaxID=2782006 RepID=UPI001F48CC1C|nr:LamG-like jellyroll fold domain-containing protein [Mongoliitalea daihaiensis]UJP63408.1 LamG domain-containing protein [Mongoliitalea daihaiensis]
MKKISLIISVVLLTVFGCEQSYIDEIQRVDPGQDVSAPTINFNFPLDGTQIRVVEDVTPITINLEVNDDIEIKEVILSLNGQEIVRFDEFRDFRRAILEFTYEELPNGEHTIEARAVDMSDRVTVQAVNFEKIEPYRPIYDNEIFYAPFDGDFTELVRIKSPTVNGTGLGFADGKVGRAYRGSANGFLVYPAENLTNQEFSAVFWYKVNGDPNRAGLLVMSAPDAVNPANPNFRAKGFRLFREAAGPNQRFKLNVGNGTGDNWFDGGAAADINPADNEWSHIAITISQQMCTVYINGEIVSRGNYSGIDWENCDIISVGSGAPRFVGWGHNSTQSLMDELRIFDAELTQEQIQTIMQNEMN